MDAAAGELAVDADQPGVVVDVGPGEAERFADPEAGVGEELEQEAVAAGVVEQLGELVGFEDRDAFAASSGVSRRVRAWLTGLSASQPRRTA